MDEGEAYDPNDPANIFDDLDRLRAESTMPASDGGGGKSTRKKWRRIKTSVPRDWEVRLLKATRISTYRLALELLYQHWRAEQDAFTNGSAAVVVSNELAESVRVSRRAKYNVLNELEQLGLIAVLRTKRKSPRAFLLQVPPMPRRAVRP